MRGEWAMSTLILRLVGPLMSFGEQGRFALRDTAALPTKSAVLGLLRSTLGLGADEPLGALASARYGVRSDRAGEPLADYHTLTSPMVLASEPDPWRIATTPPITRLTVRHYLQDAAFTCALEHQDDGLLELIDQALLAPAFLIFLGRKACPVSLPVRPPGGGIRDMALDDALYDEPLLERHDDVVTLETEIGPQEAWLPVTDGVLVDRSDQPTEHSLSDRMHHTRTVLRRTEPAARFPPPAALEELDAQEASTT